MRENYILLAIVIAILSCCCNQNLALGSPLSEENREYTITFVSDLPVEGWKELSEYRKYNSNDNCFLPTIKTYGYTFAGWEDEHGNLITNNKIPKNTVAQNIRLKAVWISNRNKFYFEPIKNPTIFEDDQDFKFYYIYPFGRIENIPIQTIRKYGYHNKGESFTFNTIKSITFKNEDAQAVSENIQKKAINSSAVTAIENWNKTNTQEQSSNITKKTEQSSNITKKTEQSWNTTKKTEQNWNTTNENTRNWSITNENGQNWNVTVTDTEEESEIQTREHEDHQNWSQTDESSHTVTDENGGSNSTTNSTMNRTRNENSSLVQHSDGTFTREHKGIEGARDLTTRGWEANFGFGKSAQIGPDSIGASLNVNGGFRIDGKQNANRLDITQNNNVDKNTSSNLNENITSQANTNTMTWNHIDSVTNSRAVTNSQGTIDKIANTIENRRSRSIGSSNGGHRKTSVTNGGTDGTKESQGGKNEDSHNQGVMIGDSHNQGVMIGDISSKGNKTKNIEQRGKGINKTKESTDEYSSANGEVSTMTYSESMEVSKSESYKLDIKHPGNYREVVAGTAYIYKIVGYNLKTGQLFTFDHYVLDDKVHTFLDFSYSTDAFNDCESAYDASFTIPAEVFNHIANKVCETKGLVVNSNTGSLDEYKGTSDTVLIPEYSCEPGKTEEDGKVVKITSLDSAYVFIGNPTIKKVILSDFITEIPDRAFRECTSLEYVWGGNIQKIGNEAFMNCKALKSISIGNLTEIGNGAFSGCTSLEKIMISSDIKSIGYKAFNSVKEVEATPDNAKIFDAIVYSGAKRISIKTDRLDANSLSGKYIYISNDTEYFYLGQKSRNKQFKNLTINSWAKESVFENIDLKSDACYNSKVWYDGSVNHTLNYDELWFNQRVYPLQLSSEKVTFYNVNIESKGVAILFDHDINLGLFGTSKIKSTNEYSIMSEKFINAYRAGGKWSAVLLTNQKVGIGGNKDIIKLQALQHFFKKENNTSANIVFGVQLK